MSHSSLLVPRRMRWLKNLRGKDQFYAVARTAIETLKYLKKVPMYQEVK